MTHENNLRVQSHRSKDRSPTFLQPLKRFFKVGKRVSLAGDWMLRKIESFCRPDWSVDGFAIFLISRQLTFILCITIAYCQYWQVTYIRKDWLLTFLQPLTIFVWQLVVRQLVVQWFSEGCQYCGW